MSATVRFLAAALRLRGLLAGLALSHALGCAKPAPKEQFESLVARVRAGKSDLLNLRSATDAQVLALGELPSLRHLILDGSPISDRSLPALGNFPELRTVSLSKTRINGTDLRPLAAVRDLRFLRLDSTGADDESLQVVGELSTLRYLSLYRCPITDRGLVRLKGLRELVILSLDETSITGAGVREMVASMPRLRYLSVWGTGVDRKTIDELSAARAEIRVNW